LLESWIGLSGLAHFLAHKNQVLLVSLMKPTPILCFALKPLRFLVDLIARKVRKVDNGVFREWLRIWPGIEFERVALG